MNAPADFYYIPESSLEGSEPENSLMNDLDDEKEKKEQEHRHVVIPNPIKHVITDAPFQNQFVESTFQSSNISHFPIIVVALEGVHGIGKTTLINGLKKHGVNVIEEHFLNTFSNFILPPITKQKIEHNCAVEYAWSGQQLLNIINLAANIRRDIYTKFLFKQKLHKFFNIIAVDRCFLTGAAYGNFEDHSTDLYQPFLRVFTKAFKEIRESHNIFTYFCYVRNPDVDKIFEHVQSRLKSLDSKTDNSSEKRKQLNEENKTFLQQKIDAYEKFLTDGYFTHVLQQNYSDERLAFETLCKMLLDISQEVEEKHEDYFFSYCL